MTSLRQRMIEDLHLRGYAERTVGAYVSVVAQLAQYHHTAPDRLSEDQLRAYLLHLTSDRKLARSSLTVALCGLRFFYEQTLGRHWTILDVARPKREKKLPVVLSRAEVWRVLAAVRTPAYRACLTTIYACGLRLLEGANLHVPHVDGARRLLHIHHGKGGVDRMVPVPQAALALLRAHWRTHRNPLWLFPAPRRRPARPLNDPAIGPIGPTSLQKAFVLAVKQSGVDRRFLLPGYVLSRIFRARMRDALTRAGLAHEVDPRVWQRQWTVHVQQIGSGRHATLYLSRYVYRVALANQRLARFTDGQVTFRYMHGRTHEPRSAILPVNTFLARFLEHVLPRGFTKIRWYGLLSPGRRKDLERARHLLALSASPPPACSQPANAERPSEATHTARDEPSVPLMTVALRCPICRRGQRMLVQRYPPSRAPP